MPLQFTTLFLYHILRKPYKQWNQLCGLPHLIWLKGICNWQWMRLTSIKQHSVQACLVSMSLLTCHSVCLMWELVFVISWRCVLEINSISCSCSISTTSVSSAALLMRCWTGSSWYWDIFRTLISKSSQRRPFSFNHKVLFLGHTLSKEGISPNPEKVQKVKDWPVPSNAKEVHSFLGLASYYRQFIPQFVKWANPLHELIRPVVMKKTHARIKLPPLQQNLPPFEWTPIHQESFDRLKIGINICSSFSLPKLWETIPFGDRCFSQGFRSCSITRRWWR